MNKIETVIYGLVKNHPWIKRTIKTVYQGLFDLLPKEKEYFMGDIQYKEGYFFGFHDVSPFSPDESKILAHKLSFDERMPAKCDAVAIGYFDFIDGRMTDFHVLDYSYAWNYHKGCRLQWISNEQIIYNTVDKGKLVSKLLNVNTGIGEIVDYPIDSVFYSYGKLIGTTFSYSRLNRCMPGYGYAVSDDNNEEEAPDDSGLFVIDLSTNSRKLCVSLKDLANNIGKSYNKGYTHFVTHSEFSHDGKYISFLYRAVPMGQEGLDMHKTWIVIYDMENETFTHLPTQESGSHYVWNSKNQIIASCVLDNKSCHVLYDINNVNDYKIVAGNVLNSDGHQSFVTDAKFITDTYPDRRRMAKLYIADINTSETEQIANVYSPKKFQTKDVNCHIACDLHPRVSHSKRYVSFDSPRTGARALYIMEL